MKAMISRMAETMSKLRENGPRRPGSQADRLAEEYLAAQLSAMGYDVSLQPIQIQEWVPDCAELAVTDGSGARRILDAGPVPHARFTPEQGISARLVLINSIGDIRRAAKEGPFIAVVDMPFAPLKPGLMRAIELDEYDPDGDIHEINHKATWVRTNWYLYRELCKYSQTLGFVGILIDQPGGTAHMYAPYGFREKDITDKPVPAVWIGKADGELLRKQAASGAEAILKVTGIVRPAVTYNVIGRLAGNSNKRPANMPGNPKSIIVSCHHDSPYAGDVEDASGCAVLLEVARCYRRGGVSSCMNDLVVVFTAGHFHGSIGTRQFIEAHPDIVANAMAALSIEHCAAPEAEESVPGGKLIKTGRPEPTAWFCSFAGPLREIVMRAIRQHKIKRSILLPAIGPLGNYPPTDGGDWYEYGVPVVNSISNPPYLLTDQDGADWINPADMEKFVHAWRHIIFSLDFRQPEMFKGSANPFYRWAMEFLCWLTVTAMSRFGRRQLH